MWMKSALPAMPVCWRRKNTLPSTKRKLMPMSKNSPKTLKRQQCAKKLSTLARWRPFIMMDNKKPFFIYNSFTKKKEVFKSLKPAEVKMYCCGPTVYDFLHIGNFRGAVFFNFLKNWLEHKGYKVLYAYNFTDVDDKILARAKKENTNMKEVSEKYIKEFQKDFHALKLKKHDFNPRASAFIPNMIKLIQKLVNKGNAYKVKSGDVFFAIKSFASYGALSGRRPEELISGARVEPHPEKKDPADFALWRACPKEEPGWESPWGWGRPGWHIECTVMIFSLFGENIDIHGGGSDLLFPHHENEKAQAESSSSQKTFAKYWVHNNMFTLGGEKMAKSTGNLKIMRSFLKDYNGEIFKYIVLSSHYRSLTEVSEKKIVNSVEALDRIYTFLKKSLKPSKEIPPDIKQAEEQIETALNDDLNTPQAFAVLFTLIRKCNEKHDPAYAGAVKKLIQKYGSILNLFQEPPAEFLKQLEEIFIKKQNINRQLVEELMKKRSLARKKKDFKTADVIKKQLLSMKVEVQDSPSGSTWTVQKTLA